MCCVNFSGDLSGDPFTPAAGKGQQCSQCPEETVCGINTYRLCESSNIKIIYSL